MIKFLKNNKWVELDFTSIKLLKEVIDIEEINRPEKLAEYIEFGFDIWAFVNPENKTLLYFTSQDKAEEEYKQIG